MKMLSLAVVLAASSIAGSSHARVDFSELGVIEIELTSDRNYANPFWDVDVAVEAVSPSGKSRQVEAFWDGGRTWRARWRGDESGSWKWTATASEGDNSGLKGSGTVVHGDTRPPKWLRASEDGTHLVDEANEPFFWLADTAWNGALRSSDADWETYLAERRKQKFTAIQYVTTQWRGGDKVIPRHLFKGTERITIDPDAFGLLDDKTAAVVRNGLRPAPVMLWALTEKDPGQALSEADAIRLARYEVARWGALAPVWLLGGDGRFLGKSTERWKRIGRGVFGDCPEQLVTLHPSGLSWMGDAFGEEDWFDFVGYQSGHGDGDSDLKWLIVGPPAQSEELGKPVINLEPNYEGHPAYQSGKRFGASAVRRAAYWSLLVHPPAGVTYGNNEIWVWNEETADAENHGNLRQIRAWREGLETDGIADMTLLRDFFESGPWTRLRPAQELLVDQPGDKDPNRFVAIAQTKGEDAGGGAAEENETNGGDWVIAYLPKGGAIAVRMKLAGRKVEWFNPRDGSRKEAKDVEGEMPTLTAPDENDWVLSVR